MDDFPRFTAGRDDREGQEIWSVGQLNRRVGELLQGAFSRVWVRGEISNFTQAASGHWYFSIKDERATVRAVMFRGRAQAVGFVPRAGEKFEFRATVTLYEPRGDYQLQVEAMRRAGRGDLHEAFLALKERLAAEGLFEPSRKRAPVSMPCAVGVITSLAAAALRDVLSALARRAPHVRVIIYPAPVQGMAAAGRLCEALGRAIDRKEVDTLLLVRGGGSLEDLWSFNDETLARMVAASPIPVISGVGHETDFTIADFVADVRAPTPTAAAELCCRSLSSCTDQLQALVRALTSRQSRFLEHAAMRLDRAVAMLVSPQERLRQQGDRLAALTQRLARAAGQPAQARAQRLQAIQARLAMAGPDMQIRRDRLARLRRDMAASAERLLERRRHRLAAELQTLRALDPHTVLDRGYAIVRQANGKIVKNALDLKVGDQLGVELGQGELQVRVLQAHGLL
ncbi:exodeoxyribonuclease VII large subunit [Allopusillimonas soli]|uniref:Exodeoxyribonuclease 7 large subunit n=1 Tax=Allopusillimonas soli TaxID=659016 RepID=A0A853FAW0_9BURK|nr:exodeoxyribonuclease VII large subunit [Allopusillimonas soli]NYT37069.1 exodeoxyribonuclease VII large subunit [Allopusillimonas soli]TEA75654.1 exodeoxyribonuclease VII large subunit [Allopusillimonas soli]